MLVTTLGEIFERDLDKLKEEINLYRQEANLWRTEKNIANAAGNLCLHIIGNLNAYIGVGLAKTNYNRQRPLEFSARDIPRAELLAQLEATKQVVQTGLNNVAETMLQNDFPFLIWDKPTTIEYTLIHLLAHLNYHLGQVNYHRRLLDV